MGYCQATCRLGGLGIRSLVGFIKPLMKAGGSVRWKVIRIKCGTEDGGWSPVCLGIFVFQVCGRKLTWVVNEFYDYIRMRVGSRERVIFGNMFV